MGRDLSPANVPLVKRYHTHRVEVDGVVYEVVSNLTLQDIAEYGRGLGWLEALAREYGRPVPVREVAS